MNKMIPDASVHPTETETQGTNLELELGELKRSVIILFGTV